MTLLDTTMLPFGWRGHPGLQMASLDHAMWFHRPFRADDWLLYDQSAVSTGAARGWRRGRCSPATAASWSASCRKASPESPDSATAPVSD